MAWLFEQVVTGNDLECYSEDKNRLPQLISRLGEGIEAAFAKKHLGGGVPARQPIARKRYYGKIKKATGTF